MFGSAEIRVFGDLKVSYLGNKLSLCVLGIEAAYLELVNYGSVIEYLSTTEPEYEGRGYNTLLRKCLHEDLEGSGLKLENFAVNPISDHILRKLGIPRTEEFEKHLKTCGSYDEAADSFEGPTHTKQF
jgi:hypothetical protein